MGVDEIRTYLSHLAVAKNVAASTQNLTLNAPLFLFRQVLQIDLPYIIRNIKAKNKSDRLKKEKVGCDRSNIKLNTKAIYLVVMQFPGETHSE